eukprot:1155966-Pelagomonas_calceolata.AAC.10
MPLSARRTRQALEPPGSQPHTHILIGFNARLVLLPLRGIARGAPEGNRGQYTHIVVTHMQGDQGTTELKLAAAIRAPASPSAAKHLQEHRRAPCLCLKLGLRVQDLNTPSLSLGQGVRV